jgi:GNAT superfamily N-acetyltransferase
LLASGERKALAAFEVTMPVTCAAVAIRRIRADEGLALRALRLAALAAAPAAFGSRFAAEAAYPDLTWHDRARRGAAGRELVTFIAERSGRWVGLATGLAGRGAGASPLLVGMFVAEPVRRLGVATALVAEIAAWALGLGAPELRLWVTAANGPARALYRRCGFLPTGARRASSHTPSAEEVELALPLEAARGS